MTDTTNSVTDAPASMIELVEMAEDAFRDVSSISGSALLAGERCPPGDKAALYHAACRVLQFVQIIRLDLPLHADSLDTLRAQLAEAQRDSERLATYFAPRRFTPEAAKALLPLELRAFNNDHPALDEWRAAIDAAKSYEERNKHEGHQ